MERKLILDFDRKQKSRKLKSNRPPPNKKSKTQPEDECLPSTSYRDRAKERREGINKDFELDPDDIISNPIVNGEQLDEDERRRQQIEDSKYLGGDVEHTHLVKGLDLKLLEKIKASEPKTKADEDRDLLFGASDSDEEEFTKEAIRAGSGKIGVESLRTTDTIPCRTAIARRILNAIDEKWPEKSKLFQPGLMSYIVSIDEEADSTVQTIIRSKSEQTESQSISEKDLAFDKLISTLAKIRSKKS